MAASEGLRKARLRLSSEGGLWEAAQRFWRKSYAGDYTGLGLLFAGFMLVKTLGQPFHQTFTLDDTRIQHPYAQVQRVPTSWLFVYAGVLPFVSIALWTLLLRRDLHKAHVTLLGLMITLFMTLLLTDVLKDAIGRPRPDLISRCDPDSSTPSDILVGVDVCTQKNVRMLEDGWRSFPSGHSSFSFAGLGWLAMFFASQSHALNPRASLLEVLLPLVPLLGAAFIAISRLEDYRHGPLDVLGGSLLGFTVAQLNFRRYYPSLCSEDCDEPYSPPGSRGSSPNDVFHRVRDEEEQFEIGEDVDDRESNI